MLNDYAERERYILGLKPNPFAVFEHLPANVPQKVLDRLYEQACKPQVATFEDEQHFESGLHGMAYNLWQKTRQHHAEELPQVQDCINLIEAFGTEKFDTLLNVLGQTDEKDILPNSVGPTPQESGDKGDFHGQDSTADSPSDTVGRSTA